MYIDGQIGTLVRDAVSPELALVDPLLAQRERVSLPAPRDALLLGPLRPPVPPFRPRPRARPVMDWPGLAATLRGWRIDSRRRLTGALALTGVVLVAASYVVTRDDEVPSTAAPPATAPSASVPPKAPATSIRVAPSPSPPKERTFAWAPDPSADGYRFELFRGARLLYGTETAKASVVVPATWTENGARRSIAPGSYRWYVWPIVDERRLANAIVQARLDVPAP